MYDNEELTGGEVIQEGATIQFVEDQAQRVVLELLAEKDSDDLM